MSPRADVKKMVAALVPIYGITLIDVVGYMIMIPLLPYLAEKFGASGLVVGALLATMAIASTIAAPFWGAASDRLGRKPIVQISQVISLIGYLALAWAPSLAMLFVARGVAGIGGGNMGVTQSYIADVTDPAHRDRAYAAFGVVFGIGIVVGPVLGGFLVRFGYWVPFTVAALIEVFNILLTWRLLPRTKRRKADEGKLGIRAAAKIALSDSRVRSLITRHFLFIFAVTYFFSIFALYVKKTMDYGPDRASWLIASAGLIGGFALVGVGPLAKRIGDAKVAQIGLALQVAAYAGLAFAHDLVPFVGDLIVWAVGASCIEPTIAALLSQSAPKDKRGATLGFNDAMSNVALMLAPSLGGWIIDRNVALIGLVPGAASLLALWIGFARRREDYSLPTGAGKSEREKRAASA